MKFSGLLELLHQGKMLRRKSWPKEYFIFKQVPAEVKGEIIPNMTSLPPDVKKMLKARVDDKELQCDSLYYNNQVAIVKESNVIEAFTPTWEDLFADDWDYSPIDDKEFLELIKWDIPNNKNQSGGQSCGVTPRAVSIEIEQFGIKIEVGCFKSQLQNKELALVLMFKAYNDLVK